MYVQLYKILRLVIIIFTSSYFLGILWHIYVVDLQETKNKGFDEKGDPLEVNFATTMLNHYDPNNTDDSLDKLVKVWYFAITTLSTIGYGDYSP